MSQKKIDYSKSMIYKLCCKDSNITDIYIGSTTNFKNRKYKHKYNSINGKGECYNTYKYQFIRDNGGFKNWDMILIENVNVDNKRDLEKIERDYIDKLKPSLNIYKPYSTIKEKRKVKKEYDKVYRQENETEIKEQRKEHYEKNKTEINEYKKQYYEKNKTEINEKRKQKINCEFCNCLIRNDNLKNHQQTIKCLKFQFIED